jgi:hypothetical protein
VFSGRSQQGEPEDYCVKLRRGVKGQRPDASKARVATEGAEQADQIAGASWRRARVAEAILELGHVGRSVAAGQLTLAQASVQGHPGVGREDVMFERVARRNDSAGDRDVWVAAASSNRIREPTRRGGLDAMLLT